MNDSNIIYRNRINQVIDYIDTHLNGPVSLETLAQVACYSPFHFHRVFVAVTGETVNGFTSRSRNEKAARLLRFSTKTISAISIDCGFSSPSTMSRSFRQYFDVTPAAFRNGQEIRNSKIRKDLFPIDQYHCSPDDEALQTKFPVEIRDLPERRIAYIRVADAFREGVVVRAFESLIEWAKSNSLYDDGAIFGMSIDDPEVTPKAKYRYEACITIPARLKIHRDKLIQTTTLPACKYAVISVTGNMDLVGEGFSYLFDEWLIHSDYECEHLPGIELFLDKENVCNWNHFDLELMIPVKKML